MKLMIIDDHDGMRSTIRALIAAPGDTVVECGSGDEAILAINNPTGWKLPQGWVYVTAGTDTTVNQQYPISSAQYSTLNQRICTTGALAMRIRRCT